MPAPVTHGIVDPAAGNLTGIASSISWLDHDSAARERSMRLAHVTGDDHLEAMLWSRRLLKQIPKPDLTDRGLSLPLQVPSWSLASRSPSSLGWD